VSGDRGVLLICGGLVAEPDESVIEAEAWTIPCKLGILAEKGMNEVTLGNLASSGLISAPRQGRATSGSNNRSFSYHEPIRSTLHSGHFRHASLLG